MDLKVIFEYSFYYTQEKLYLKHTTRPSPARVKDKIFLPALQRYSSRLGNPGWFSIGMVRSPDVMKDRSQCNTVVYTRVLNLVERSTKFSTKYLVDLDLPRYSHVYSSVMCVHTAVHGRSTKFTAVVSG